MPAAGSRLARNFSPRSESSESLCPHMHAASPETLLRALRSQSAVLMLALSTDHSLSLWQVRQLVACGADMTITNRVRTADGACASLGEPLIECPWRRGCPTVDSDGFAMTAFWRVRTEG